MSNAWAKGSDTRWRTFRAFILSRDNYRCQIRLPGCTTHAPLAGGHVDHITPLSRGGAKYDPGNARAACPSCNLKRGNRGPGAPPPAIRHASRW